MRQRKGLWMWGVLIAIAAGGCMVNSAAVSTTAEATEEVLSKENTSVAENPAQASSLQITDTGISTLTVSTPFDVAAVQAAFPDLIVSTTTEMAEGTEYEIIVVSEGDSALLKIESADTKIYRVTVVSSQVSGPAGHTVGEVFSDIYGGAVPEDCLRAVDSELITCPAPASEKVRYLFANRSTGIWSGAYHELPPSTELSSGTLTEIAWNTGNY